MPHKKKGGAGASTPGRRPTFSSVKADENTPTVQAGADKRSNPALPGLVTAEILPPAPGRTRAVLVVKSCPKCGGTHLHYSTRRPTPTLLTRRAGCGHRYEVIPRRRKAVG